VDNISTNKHHDDDLLIFFIFDIYKNEYVLNFIIGKKHFMMEMKSNKMSSHPYPCVNLSKEMAKDLIFHVNEFLNGKNKKNG
jgi:hypothetical protein